MNEIEDGEFFELNTDNKLKAFKMLMTELKNSRTVDKGKAASLLYTEEVYKQKKDCKDFIKNIVRSSNLEVVSLGKRKMALSGKVEVRN